MTVTSLPTQLELDMMHVYNGLQHAMNPQAQAAFMRAIDTLKERGAPDPDSYSLSRIVAEDVDDLNLKLHLATMNTYKDYLDGKLSEVEAAEQIMPLMQTLSGMMMKLAANNIMGVEEDIFPLTIDVDAMATPFL